MRYILLLFLPLFLLGESTFITPIEYASQLYKNPRGIGCEKCHGESGEGKLVAKYMHNGEKREFNGNAINTITFDKFYKALNVRKRGMPRYFLTKREIKALYFYLQEIKIKKQNKEEKNGK